ncbi:MAG: ribonuclease Y [Firmicutes bacterium]|nr:ribonuclease Y [Bacillota bacterium]
MVPVVVTAIIVGILCLGAGLAIGMFVNAKLSKKKLGDAKALATKYINDAMAEAKTLRKDAMLDAKEEIFKQKQDVEKEIKERREEVKKSEDRILQKEDALDKKNEALDKKEEGLDKKIEALDEVKKGFEDREKEIAKKQQLVDTAHEKMVTELEKVAGLKKEDAKKQLVQELVSDAKIEAAKMVRDLEQEAKEESDKKGREILAQAIQRCAVDHSAEITVSVVPIPSDDMKGRIIGREGRNIRALESATGIDLIIDDTPEAIVLSGFDPVRREIARRTLEKLIGDGRIHPARIEETVEKIKKEVEGIMKEAGEQAVFDAGVYNLSPELIKLLGRLKYRTSYGQNVLKHSLEVSFLAGIMAQEIGADVKLARRAGLLHDIGKAIDHETDGTHISIGADLAKKHKENADVIHCIAAHHNDIEPETVEAVLIQVADAVSGARPGARRESLENYVKRLEQLEGIASGFDGVEKSFAIQAGREVRVMVKPDKVSDDQIVFLAKDIAKKIEAEMEYPGQIKVNIIRETRSTEFAK